MRGWTRILRRGVLGYVLPRLSFLWCYGVFCCSVPLRVVIVFRDTIYVIIIILYLWQLVICEPFWPYVWNNWSWVMHMMSTWFWCKNWVWRSAMGMGRGIYPRRFDTLERCHQLKPCKEAWQGADEVQEERHHHPWWRPWLKSWGRVTEAASRWLWSSPARMVLFFGVRQRIFGLHLMETYILV
jgi:hypothetical protein